jgi:hypothetical protein
MLKVSDIWFRHRYSYANPLLYHQVGIDEEDDRKRQAVLADWKSWLLKRVEIDRKAGYNPGAQ